jgi:uncharacterized RDD family membrane protein YckC
MDDYTPSQRRGYRRLAVAAILVLLALGLFPAAAAVLDERSEGWILPLFVLVMLVSGALLWTFVPGTTDATRTTGHRVAVGCAAGLGAAILAIVVFYALLNGYSGA